MKRRAKRKKSRFYKVMRSLFFDETPKRHAKTKCSPRRKTAEKKKRKGELARYAANPIVMPLAQNAWEAWQTFNPGAVLLDDRVHFLYRAIGHDGLSRFGYAVSEDGFHVSERLSEPVYEHALHESPFNYYSFVSGGSFGGAEDPRIVRVNEEDTLYMTYTACDNGLGVALTSIALNDFLSRKWHWRNPQLLSKPGETHKNWVIFPEKINGKYAILHSVNPRIQVAYRDSLEFQKGEYIESYYNGVCRKKCWDTCVRGAGAPPIKTKDGWLLLYHAIDESDPGKYKVGAMLLDLYDPTIVLYRSQEPILEPEEDYATHGFKPGVVYVSGAVVKDGELLVYYGSADSYVSVAHVNLDEFLKVLKEESKLKLRLKRVQQRAA